MPTFEATPRPDFGSVLLEKELASDPYYKEATVERIVQTLKARGCLSRADEKIVRVALDEAFMNAIQHGNRSDATLRIRFRLFADDARWAVVIEDSGEGMTPDRLRDPLAPEGLRRESGRGIRILDTHFDEVVYMGSGNQLLLVRSRSEPDPEAVSEAMEEAPLDPDSVDVTETRRLVRRQAEATDVAIEIDDDEDDDYLAEPERETLAGELESSNDTLRVLRFQGVRVVELLPPRMSDRNIELVKCELTKAIEGESTVVLDLSRVEYISSVVIGALVGIATRLEESGGQLRLASVPPLMADLFDTTGVAELFSMFPDPRSAVEAS